RDRDQQAPPPDPHPVVGHQVPDLPPFGPAGGAVVVAGGRVGRAGRGPVPLGPVGLAAVAALARRRLGRPAGQRQPPDGNVLVRRPTPATPAAWGGPPRAPW